MRRLLAIASVAAVVLVAGGAAADTFSVTIVSQTSSTITLGWTPQPGYGYLFSANGVLVSRTNNASRSTVVFSKNAANSYDIDVIVKGANGHCCVTPPPPTAKLSQTIVNGSTLTGVVSWHAVYDGNNDGVEDDPGSMEWRIDNVLVRTEVDVPFGDDSSFWASTSVGNGSHQFEVRAINTGGVVLATNTVTATVANGTPPPAVCADGLDNDGDGKIDYPADPGCTSPSDTNESDVNPASCNLNATTANFAAQVAAASPGQTVCLASGNYGTWTGTNKAIGVAAATGASPQMQINFGSSASGFTLTGMAGMAGDVNGSTNVTIRNATFTGPLDIDNAHNVIVDHSTFNWNAVYNGGTNGKIRLEGTNHGTFANPAFTISNSEIRNGDLDGIHIGGDGYQILNNVFDNLCDVGTNHTDNIQFEGGAQTRIAGNYFHVATCETQGITSFDSGTVGIVIENNVVDISRLFGIELYSDRDSIVRHNTVVYRAPNTAGCGYGSSCGRIDISRKSADPAGSGTHVYDNITSGVSFSSGSTGSEDHNVSGQNAIYVGPLNTHNGFLLAPNSPVGRNAASDGTNAGVYP